MCNCIDETNKILEEKTGTIFNPFFVATTVESEPKKYFLIPVVQKASSGRPVEAKLAARFCPLCGKEYGISEPLRVVVG